MPESDGLRGAWYAGLVPGEIDVAVDRIRSGSADAPEDWPVQAVADGFSPDEETYFEHLHEASLEATRRAVAAREGADDQQVIHAIRAIDDLDRIANTLAERVAEWARTTDLSPVDSPDGMSDLAAEDPGTPVETEVVALAETVVSLRERRETLVRMIERTMHDIAPNLTALAGSLLGARLIALAGGLDDFAKLPSSTVQVLGAEDALFAHLRGDATSPKHGIIFTHEFVRGTDPDERGSAARALAGKLAIAGRIDHYAGDRRPKLERDLADRMDRIRERSG